METKLWAGIGLKREYELVLGNEFKVVYGYCVSKFLQNKFVSSDKKFVILKQILRENDIDVLYGDDENYFATLDKWIGG